MSEVEKHRLAVVRSIANAVLVGGLLMAGLFYLLNNMDKNFNVSKVVGNGFWFGLILLASLGVGSRMITWVQEKRGIVEVKTEGEEQRDKFEKEFERLMRKHGSDPDTEFSWGFEARIAQFKLLDDINERLKRIEEKLESG